MAARCAITSLVTKRDGIAPCDDKMCCNNNYHKLIATIFFSATSRGFADPEVSRPRRRARCSDDHYRHTHSHHVAGPHFHLLSRLLSRGVISRGVTAGSGVVTASTQPEQLRRERCPGSDCSDGEPASRPSQQGAADDGCHS